MGYIRITQPSITTYIDPEGVEESQQLNISIGSGTSERRVPLCVGNMETRNKTTNNNYDKGSIDLVYNAEGNWVNIWKDEPDQTAAHILYTCEPNEGDDTRETTLTIQGNTDNSIIIKQNPIIRLMYMIKETSEKYGEWFQVMKINTNKASNSTLQRTQDISIFNGKYAGGYNEITVEIQPYKQKEIHFGFSHEQSLDKLIKEKYEMTVTGTINNLDSATAYNIEDLIIDADYQNTGYFTFKTPKGPNFNMGLGGTVITDVPTISDMCDVSALYKFTPISGNYPVINIYITNLLAVKYITKFDLRITCDSVYMSGGSMFIKGANINVGADPVDADFITWPRTQGTSITFQNVTPQNPPNITFDLDYVLNAGNVMVNSANIGQPNEAKALTYKVSILNITFDDGTTAPSEQVLTLYKSRADTSILYFTQTPGDNTLSMYIDTNINRIKVITTYRTGDKIYALQIGASEHGISVKAPLGYRWANGFAMTDHMLTISMMDRYNGSPT